MSKIQIDIPKDVYEKLKKQAEDDDRSLTKYIIRGLKFLSEIPEGYHKTNANANNNNAINSNIIDLSALPEGATIRATTTRPKTAEEIEEENIKKFQKLAKQILGHEVPIGEVDLSPNNRYYDFAPEHEGKFLRWAYEMPQDKQIEYLKEWRLYE